LRPQLDDLDIFGIGPKFERNGVFPARTNTEFTEVRGAGGAARVGGSAAGGAARAGGGLRRRRFLGRQHVAALAGWLLCLAWRRGAGVGARGVERGPPLEAPAGTAASADHLRGCPAGVQVLSRSHVRMVVWERGAGRTLACGTGACATVVAGVLEGKVDRSCQVDLPGGPLHIEWRESDNHIYMTGPAELVFGGLVDV
jgi:hypothetical protein